MTEMDRREFGRAGFAGLTGFAVQQRRPVAVPSPADGRAYRYIPTSISSGRTAASRSRG